MPYYISDEAEGCSGWATVKDDGEIMGCHDTKQEAIDQALAIAQAEGSTYEGERQVELNLPGYIRDAAAQGIEWHEEGLSGDGVVPRTVREARQMARGEISEDKVTRVSAWAARHATDLDAEGARPDEDGFPTPGAVAHYLWGIPTGARYPDAVAWFDRKAEQIREDEGRSMSTATPVKPRSSKSGVEFRSVDYEIRTDGEGRTFTGYAAMFDSPSEPLPFIERIAPGAFARSLANRKRDVRLYVNHNSDMVLASKRSGTLRLAEDDRGLRVDADLPDTSYANDLRALMEAGVVSKMSFGFSVPRGGDKWSDDGSERVLRAVTLHEVSVVTGFPAYDATQAAVRSLEKLSERTGLAVDELTEALDALSDGSELTEEQAAALKAAVDQASPRNEPDAPNLLTIKSLKTELLGKKII